MFKILLNAAHCLFVFWGVMALMRSVAFAGTETLESTDSRLLLVNARIVDIERQAVRQGALLIDNGRVIAELNKMPSTYDGKVIDLGNRWIMPGLIDLHVHAFGNRAPHAKSDNPGIEGISRRALLAGVTGFLDLFGDENTLLTARQRQRDKVFFGADIHASLSCLTAPGGHCTEYGIETRTMKNAAEAAQVVDALAKLSPDAIKIVYQPSDDQPSIDKETFRAAVEASRKYNVPTVVHIKTWQDIRDAIEVGATAVTHVPSGKVPADLPGLMAQSGIVMIPTLTVETDLTDFVFTPEVLQSTLAQTLTTSAIVQGYADERTLERWGDREAKWRAADAEILGNVRQLHEAGVKLLVGTDAGNWGTIQGFSVHRELFKLTQAGMTAWQALAAATTKAGEFLDLQYGIKAGSQASFVILNDSPVDNILNTQDIHMVIHHGVIVDQQEVRKQSFE